MTDRSATSIILDSNNLLAVLWYHCTAQYILSAIKRTNPVYLAFFLSIFCTSGYSLIASSKSVFDNKNSWENPLDRTSAVRLLPPARASKLYTPRSKHWLYTIIWMCTLCAGSNYCIGRKSHLIHVLVFYGRPLSVSGRPCYILPMFFFYLFFLWPPYSPALVNGGSRKFYTW